MKNSFDLQKAMSWASTGSKTGKPSVSVREKTLARHNSELKCIKKVNLSDENSIKREILNSNEVENKYRNFSFEGNIPNTDLNLNEILDKGLSGELPSLTQDDWLLITILVNQGCWNKLR